MRLLPGIVCAVLLSPVGSATADTVTCGDGTTSESGRGACSHHGGVVRDGAEPRAERPRATKPSQARKATTRKRTQAGVICNDGTRSSSSAAGACSDHGGIAGTIAIERDAPQPRPDRDPVAPLGDGVLCADGTRSTTTARGACSRHGGVIGANASQPEPRLERDAAARRSESRTPDTDSILCNDGTLSTPIRRGACSGHGGISDGSEKFERHDGPIRERAPSTNAGALCSDGTRSTTTGQGACSHHGGVLKAPPLDHGERPEPGTPIAVCKDGDISYSMHASGTCSDHGGVAHWL